MGGITVWDGCAASEEVRSVTIDGDHYAMTERIDMVVISPRHYQDVTVEFPGASTLIVEDVPDMMREYATTPQHVLHYKLEQTRCDAAHHQHDTPLLARVAQHCISASRMAVRCRDGLQSRRGADVHEVQR